MKKVLAIIAVLILLFLGGLGIVYQQLQQGLDQPAKGVAEEVYVVEQGATLGKISEDLHKKGWLFHPKTLVLLSKLREVPNNPIRHGRHRLKPGMTPIQILLELQEHGKVELSSVSIPEGFTYRKIAERLAVKGIINNPARFLELVENPKMLSNPKLKNLPTPTLEGYLFPDTYLVKPPMDEEKMIELMAGELFKRLDQDPVLSQVQDPAELHRLLTLASIVEREAKAPQERKTVAGLYSNRLRKGMKLECDATVQYALPEYQKRVLNSDLEVDSPYNTYKIVGLPPGPIASPGLSAIQAAHQPEENEFLYMVAKPDGTHRFGRNWAEHTQNVRIFRQQMRQGDFGDVSR